MEVVNEVNTTDPERINEMLQPGPEGPIFMVNLLKYKDKAEYADGRETDLTGEQAYRLYGEEVVKLVAELGGQPVFGGRFTFLMLGQVEELWDDIAIMMYPRRSSLLEMVSMEKYREIAVHRDAGLKGQLNIETVLPAWLKAGG